MALPPVMPRSFSTVAAMLLAAAVLPCHAQSAASATVVYRCPGPVYQQMPCTGGRELRIDPATNAVAAPSAADRALAAQWDARANGPWVATLPMPPRMTVTPSQSRPSYGFGGYYPATPWFGWTPPVQRWADAPTAGPESVPSRPSRSAR